MRLNVDIDERTKNFYHGVAGEVGIPPKVAYARVLRHHTTDRERTMEIVREETDNYGDN